MKSSNGVRGAIARVTMLQVLLLVLVFTGAAQAATVMLDWDPSTDEDLAGYRVYYQANTPVAPFQGMDAAEGSAPIDVANVDSATISGLDAGNSYYFAVTAYNSAGVESVYSNIVEIAESLPPSVSISSPTGSSSVSGTVPVTVSAQDNKGVSKVEFYVNGALQETVTVAPYGFNWNTAGLTSGIYTLAALAFDAAGNVGQGEVQVAVTGDTTAPTVSISAPGDNSSVAGVVTITATASDDVGVTKLELYDNGSLILAGNQSQISYNWDSVAAGNGSHFLAVRAFDAAGNYQTASVSVMVANDFAPPSVAVTSPYSGSTVGSSVNVIAAASDDVGIERVEFYLDGALQVTDSSAPFGFSLNTFSLANGSHTLSAKAYDAAGNVGTSEGVTITVFNDTTAPTVSISAPTSGNTVDKSVAVILSASDNLGVTRIDLYLDGTLLATSNSTGFTFDWNTSGLANGAYTLTAKAYDAAGNVGMSAALTVNVLHPVTDTVEPVVTFSAPTSAYVYGTNTRISGSASDNVAVTRMELYIDGKLTASSASGSINIKLKLTYGQHNLTMKAYDAAGNVGISTMTVNRIF